MPDTSLDLTSPLSEEKDAGLQIVFHSKESAGWLGQWDVLGNPGAQGHCFWANRPWARCLETQQDSEQHGMPGCQCQGHLDWKGSRARGEAGASCPGSCAGDEDPWGLGTRW